mmetsp:Transcript_38744/g.68003  ORF Transcript_38744/g.68003 Transcript_38744/m.68003 type:complete len:169 (+) Transcript_38744:265-771(+)
MRSQTESSHVFDDIARLFRNVPPSAYEAQVREYEMLHQAHTHIQRLRSQTKQTYNAPRTTVDDMDHLPSNTAASIAGTSLRPSPLDAFGGVARNDNHPFAHTPQVSSSDPLRQAGIGQLTTMGNAIGSSDGKQDEVKPPPDQCHSLAVPKQTEHHTKSVTCKFCNSHL